MVRIWYDASVTAHSFIPSSFWALQKNEMKEKYLPLAENLVFEEEERWQDSFPYLEKGSAPSW